MAQPNLKGLVLAGAVTLPVGIVLFIGGIIAIIGKLVALGGVLMAAAVVSLATGCVLMVIIRSRARAYSRDLQAGQQAGLDATFRNYPGGRLP